MNKVTEMISKVATTARKAVLLGALVGGVSMMAYATETTETKVGPTIEKAQLETVDINLEAVVAAITKADPDWVKSLPVVNVRQSAELFEETWYFDPQPGSNDPDLASNYSRIQPEGVTCGTPTGTICSIQDIADPSNNDQPKMSHGLVSTDTGDQYDKTLRLL